MAREAVIVDSVRTGLAKAQRGSFNNTEPVEYTAHVLREVVAERYGISREDQDKYALMSQQRYAKSVEDGKVSEDIVPMQVTRKVIKKDQEPFEEEWVIDRDECNRPRACAAETSGAAGPERRGWWYT